MSASTLQRHGVTRRGGKKTNLLVSRSLILRCHSDPVSTLSPCAPLFRSCGIRVKIVVVRRTSASFAITPSKTCPCPVSVAARPWHFKMHSARSVGVMGIFRHPSVDTTHLEGVIYGVGKPPVHIQVPDLTRSSGRTLWGKRVF